MATKRHIIKYKNTVEQHKFTVIGISSHENDYRLSWNINEELRLAFVRDDDNIETGDGKEFACFIHQDEEQRLLLISNRCDNGFMIEKHKNLDFILKFDTELTEYEINEWLKKLRQSTLVSAAFTIEPDKMMMKLFSY